MGMQSSKISAHSRCYILLMELGQQLGRLTIDNQLQELGIVWPCF